MKKTIKGCLTIYQKYISPLSASRCRFYPSCSEYAKLAVESNGVFKGLLLGVYRVLRCNPFGKSGVDYPPNFICKDQKNE